MFTKRILKRLLTSKVAEGAQSPRIRKQKPVEQGLHMMELENRILYDAAPIDFDGAELPDHAAAPGDFSALMNLVEQLDAAEAANDDNAWWLDKDLNAEQSAMLKKYTGGGYSFDFADQLFDEADLDAKWDSLESLFEEVTSLDNENAVQIEDEDALTDQQQADLDSLAAIFDQQRAQADAKPVTDLVVIDKSVDDYDLLLADILANAVDADSIAVTYIDSSSDGLSQIGDAIAQYDGLFAVHLVSHGSQGELQLGATNLTLANVDHYSAELDSWRESLSADADLLFYGCDVAGSSDGQQMLERIGLLSGTDVAASDDLTGHQSLGGDWELEFEFGEIDTEVAFSSELQLEWVNVLGELSVGNEHSGSHRAFAIDANGNRISVFTNSEGDVDDASAPSPAVFFQRADYLGNLVGGTTQVNQHTDGDQKWASIATDALGNFAVTWTSEGQAGQTSGIYARLFDSDGVALTNEFLVSSSDAADFGKNSSIAMNIDGEFVIVWEGAVVGNDSTGVFAQRFNDDGSLHGGTVQVNSTTAGTQYNAVAAINDTGDIAVAWTDGGSVFSRQLDFDTGVLGDEITSFADSGITDAFDPSVDINESGSFIVSATVDYTFINNAGIRARVYDVDGNTVGAEVFVNSVTANDQANSQVSLGEDGSFVVAWDGYGSTDSDGVYKREFNSSLVAVEADQRVNAATAGVQSSPSIARFPDGSYSILFSNVNGASSSIIGANYNPAPPNQAPESSNNTAEFVAGSAYYFSQSDFAYSDNEGDTFDFIKITSLPIKGTLTLDGTAVGLNEEIAVADINKLVFTNAAGESGTAYAKFEFRVKDSNRYSLIDYEMTINANNTDPTINTGSSFDADENQTAVTTITASDSESGVQTLSFSIDSGDDQALFSIDAATGVLSFNAAPNFENPGDANTDNDYEVVVRADDGNGGFDLQAISISVQDTGETIVVETNEDRIDGNVSSIEALLNDKGGDGKISLREAIIAANNTAGADTIVLGAETYAIANGNGGDYEGDFDIKSTLTIVGAGSGSTFISGNGFYHPLEIHGETFTMTDLTVTGGSMLGDGGGMRMKSGSDVMLERVVFSGNSANHGGAIYVDNSTLTAFDSTFTSNAASQDGGAIYNNKGTVDLERVTIDMNSASGDGGGIYSKSGSAHVDLTNVTISGNAASVTGGAIYTNETVSILNSTIASNTGGGGLSANADDLISIRNSIVSDNVGGNSNRAVISLGNNIDSGNSLQLSEVSDFSNTDAGLGALSDNGGYTRTHALDGTSIAIERGSASAAPSVDQRGVARSGATDIGAYESSSTNANPVFTTVDTLTVDENETDIMPVNANDPESGTVTYSIVGGLDETLFNINAATGVLTFSAPRDFEAPGDSNSNNVYVVEIQADDGSGGTSTQTIQITVRDVAEELIVDTNLDTVDGDYSSIANLLADKGADNKISLREAIMAANNTVGASTITLSANEYVITSTAGADLGGDFNVRDDITIIGAGADNTTISGNSTTRIFFLHGAELNLTGLTLEDGFVTSGGGGAIATVSGSDVTLDHVILQNNTGLNGGAIRVTDSNLSAVDSVFTGNTAVADGGAILNDSGNVTLERVSIYDNDAARHGGAINNTGAGAVLNLTNVTISGNSAVSNGGAIYSSGTATITNSTIANNSASLEGGGFYQLSDNLITLQNTIVANNLNGNSNRIVNSLGNNIDSGNTLLLSELSDMIDTDAGLSALSDNGGFSQTHALQSTSVAIGAGDSASAPTTDQRGQARDANADIGAFEYDSGITGPLLNAADAVSIDENSTAVKTVTPNYHEGPVSFSITGGDDASLFSINASTGELVFDAAPDYENPLDSDTNNGYEVAVTASDSNGNSSEQTIIVTVSPLNEHAPIFSTPNSLFVAENETSITTLVATDNDDSPLESISYSIAGGADASLFTINSATGELGFDRGRNYESPIDSDRDNVYEVTITASDNDGRSTPHDLAVTITNVEESPRISDADFSIDENAVDGTALGDIDISQHDDQVHAFTITNGDPDGAFAIDSSGKLTVADGSLLDFESQAVWTLEVTATDPFSNSDTATITIDLNDLNENPIVNDQGWNLREDAVSGDTVGTVMLAANDLGDSLTYTWDQTGNTFRLNSETGEITVRNPSRLDFESIASFEINVSVTDDAGLSDDAVLTFNIDDVNEAPTARDDSFNVNSGESIAVNGSVLLRNDFDPENQTLSAVLVSDVQHGALSLNADGSFSFIPDKNFVGSDSFTYVVTDGTNTSSQATVEIEVNGVSAPIPESDASKGSGSESESSESETSESSEGEGEELISLDPSSEDDSDDEELGQLIESGSSKRTASQSENSELVSIVAASSESDALENAFSQILIGGVDAIDTVSSSNLQVNRLANNIVEFSTDSISDEILYLAGNKKMWDELGELSEDIVVDPLLSKVALTSVAGFSGALTVTYVLWLVRGGYLMASVLSSLPAWRFVDPLPILDVLEGTAGDDGESIESIIREAEAR